MFDLLETFRIENGKVAHLDYHQARLDKAQQDIYQVSGTISLQDFFNHHTLPINGIFRGRMLYEEEINQFEIIPYHENTIKTFSLCELVEFEYPYKWADRSFFVQQKELHPESDEIIFYSKNKIQDCCIANLAFLKNDKWYTPKSPLLEGTTRARLLAENKIQELDIFVDKLIEFDRICPINVFRELSLEKSLLLAECIL